MNDSWANPGFLGNPELRFAPHRAIHFRLNIPFEYNRYCTHDGMSEEGAGVAATGAMGGKPLLINTHVEKARLRAEAEAGRTLRKRFERLRKQQEQEAADRDDSDGDFWVPDEDPECD